MHTLMQRLVADDKLGLNFDYMGASEYEFGTAHAALNVMANDFGVPHEVRETRLFIRKTDCVTQVREGEPYHDAFGRMLDGRPLLLRSVPGISHREGADRLAEIGSVSSIMNKGGLMRRGTLAWLVIDPTVGLLYHPSQEEAVENFLKAVRALREKSNTDRKARLSEAIRDACRDSFCGTDSASAMRLRDEISG